MNPNFFEEYPELYNLFGTKTSERRYEVLENLKSNDEIYASLIESRSKQSMIVRNILKNDAFELEKYIDLINAQEIYELDAIYVYAFRDAISALLKLKMLP